VAEFYADLRDIRFNLFDLLDVGGLAKFERYKDIDVPTMHDILDAAEQISREVLFACNEEGDRFGVKFEHGKVTFAPGFTEAYKAFCEAEFNGMSVRPEHGGGGFPFALHIAAQEMFTAANTNFMFTPGLTLGALGLIHEFGSPEQRGLFAAKMLSGRWSGTMCLTEPSAGTAVPDLRSVARPIDGRPGFFKIKGQKIFISSGEHDLTENIVHMVLARVEGDPSDHRGVSLFIVPKNKIDASGNVIGHNDVTCIGIEEKMGIHGSATCQLSFGDDDDCEGWLIGGQGEGLRCMFKMMNESRIYVGLQGVSASNLSYQRAVRYAKERVQGSRLADMRKADPPRVPIIEHADVKRMLMSMKALAEGGRALMIYASYCEDRAWAANDDKERNHWHYQAEVLTPIVKAWCSDMGFDACNMGVQVLGGYGYIREYGQEQLLRDVRIASIYEGTNGVQAMDLLGRKVARGGGVMMMALLNEVNKTLLGPAKDGPFADELVAIGKARDALAQTAMSFGQLNMRGDVDFPAFHAVRFLQMFGDLVVAWLLMRQALVAKGLYDKRLADQDVDPMAEGFGGAFLADDAELRFLHGKMETARFFVHQVMSRVHANAAAIKSNDRSALTMVF
jgi:alkylation response protein AidB-like acyl-CoA dehydrogenase